MQTRIANVIDSTSNQSSYDKCVKALLANRSILTWILKCCVDEFKSFDLNTIAGCIKGAPDIATKALHRNEEFLNGNDEIAGDNSEDSCATEERVTFDLRFTAVVPNTQKPIELIINVEAQRTKPSYDIEKRAIYYMSRLISGQYGTVFRHSEYGKIEKVYSIWFCMNPSGYMKNTISQIKLHHTSVYGNAKLKPRAVDIMQGVIINLGDASEKIDNDILNLMNILLSDTISADEKKRVLEEDFKIAMTEELESGVVEMCNLSQSVLEHGEVRGEKRLATLFQRLFAAGRNNDALKASEDAEYRTKLMIEFGLK